MNSLFGSGGGPALDYYRFRSRILINLLIFSGLDPHFKRTQPEVQINLPDIENSDGTRRPSWSTAIVTVG